MIIVYTYTYYLKSKLYNEYNENNIHLNIYN